MDSFFKAAVCDLDKLLDDFELNTEELDCRPVYQKSPAYAVSSSGPQCMPPEGSTTGPPNLPDLNSLHYGSAPGFKGQPLTGVDLLSSVDRRPAKGSTPPCPDRTLKPHPVLSHLWEGVRAERSAGAVDTLQASGGNVESLGQIADGYSASLSLLDVILPAAVERSCAPPANAPHNNYDDNTASEDPPETDQPQDSGEADSLTTAPDTRHNIPAGLSCLPMAVSMCGALVNSTKTAKGSPDSASEVSDDTEAESFSSNGVCSNEQINRDAPRLPRQPAMAAASLALRPLCPGSPDTLHAPSVLPVESHVEEEEGSGDSPEFGFEYLPESDQAELLVTDEELEAFLQAHAEAEQVEGGAFLAGRSSSCARGGGGLSGMCGPDGDPEHRLVEEELGGYEAELCSRGGSSATPNTPAHPQHVGSPDLQSSYGGARPKQLHCPAATFCPVAEEAQQGPPASDAPISPDEDATPTSPPHPRRPVTADNGDPRLLYAPQADRGQDPSFDEQSEPPPYPGEPSREYSGSLDEGSDEGLGCRQPSWVPDAEAPKCMSCDQRFTFTRRRHHCRACGKVYCAICCNRKCKLQYLEKEARVCNGCFENIQRALALERMMSPTGPSPNPNVPSEYCSTIPPLQQARAAGTLHSPPPTVMVPVSVLKHPSNDGGPREQKRVWFADGILPNGEVADTTRLALAPVGSEDPAAPGVVRPPVSGPWDYALLCGIGCPSTRGPSMLPEAEGELPPLIITTGEDETQDVLVEEGPAPCQIMLLLEEGGPQPLTFLLNANLLVNVKLVTYCEQRCWCFGSTGLQALGQRELVFLVECLPEEKTLPRDLFSLYLNIYQDAQNGKFVEDLGNVTFTSSFLGSKEHGGMLFFSPTCQPLEGLSLPPQPFLFGLLIQRLEVPWAKVFPLRLLLRLGTGHSVYPTTPVSVRFRESVYRETGHTIMNLLADLRNFQYSIAIVEGLRIHMEMGHSYIDIPKSRFNEMQKVVNSSNEHVISVGATFSSEADSHLVCFQNEDGTYQTQANSKPGHIRTVTGASFVVFNGALKASSGFIAKSSIVEDGLMVQIPPETMESLRAALRDQTDFLIPCGKSDGGELRENVTVRWVDWTAALNVGVTSGVDGRSLDGVYSLRTQHDSEFESDGRVIRCTEVFYQLKSAEGCLATVVSSSSVFQREMSLATCSALAPHLAVEYQAGSGGRLLPQCYMKDLDSSLIPVIHGGSAGVPQFRERVRDILPALPAHHDHYLLRWLRARSFNVTKSEAMIRKHVEFRRQMRVDAIISEWEPPEGLMLSATKQDFLKSKLRHTEILQRECRKQSEKLGKNVEAITLIYDCEGLGLKHVWKPAIDAYGEILTMFEENYPEAPKLFPMAYNLIKHFLCEETKRKIVILGANWQEELRKHVDKDQLPAVYGGALTDPDGDPRCRTMINYGGPVPKSYYVRDSLKVSYDASVSIGRGSVFDLEYDIAAPSSVLRWQFASDGADIGFGVFRKSQEDGTRLTVLPSERYNAHLVPEDQSLLCTHPGVYVLRFDNSYSYLHSKRVSYNVEVLPPPPAGPNARLQ
ncbi:hypothetical protein NHX12_027199 [Muraenolepis orangiensis]|uniref:FYVE-type domain-containing protein n=1 Tax=Muraenolepis orangiensis TaxID=630683 RepID=A0A9Q0ED50_9TELE|nr:hypothetical protein NHX12_027199 [Muraenolepis orangiensis]